MGITSPFRPPCVPLITHTPFFSAWSATNKLNESWPQHWTGQTNAMMGYVLVDGKPYRWMGPNGYSPVPALEQVGVEVTATRSKYEFSGAGIRLEVLFCSPLIAKDIELLARPASYIRLSAQSADGKDHKVQAYVDWTGEWVAGKEGGLVRASRYRVGGNTVLSIQNADGQPLGHSGDQVTIDWGSLYVSGPEEGWIAGHRASRDAFCKSAVPDDDLRFPRSVSDDWPVVALSVDLSSPKTLTVAFDEVFAVESFNRKLRPYWNRRERGPSSMIAEAVAESDSIIERATKFDRELWAALEVAGGAEYAQMASLAYRQCLAGHTIAEDVDGDLLMFSKENTSNGCIATVDVTFPASPFFLYFNPKLLEAQLRPILEYASMPRWKFPFAPHDLGQFPLANGQVYGGGERSEENQMPVEESANMLLMAAAIHRSNPKFCEPFLPVLKKWAKYLRDKGLDPENQLCTDDFTGHLAHNANLSIKAIIALAAYGEIAGEASYRQDAATLAKQWASMADDGDHTKLAFDKPRTWSQKYNLLWDKLLGYHLFDQKVVDSELAWYKKQTNKYGFPLDNRATFTKTDWLLWCAALSPNKADFQSIIHPVYSWLNETQSRVPFTDWYDTLGGETRGMHSRTVIGGVFSRALVEKGLTP